MKLDDQALREKWESATEKALRNLAEALNGTKDRLSKDAALTAAICTDKVLLLQGRPTQIVANLHQHRHELGDLVGRLTAISGQIQAVKPVEVIDVVPEYVLGEGRVAT